MREQKGTEKESHLRSEYGKRRERRSIKKPVVEREREATLGRMSL